MNDLEFTFEESPWEQFTQSLKDSDILTVSAFQILTLLEGESEQQLEDAGEDDGNGVADDAGKQRAFQHILVFP